MSVEGVVGEMLTQFCYVDHDFARKRWWHWHRANVINKDHLVGGWLSWLSVSRWCAARMGRFSSVEVRQYGSIQKMVRS